MEAEERASIEAPLRKVKRATGLLKDAARELAAAIAGDDTVLGVSRVHDAESQAAVDELISLGRGQHGAVDVVVIARPTGRRGHPPRPHEGEGERDGQATPRPGDAGRREARNGTADQRV